MVNISTHKQADFIIVEVHGEVDASSSLQLDEAIVKATEHGERVIIDCTNLKYISSAGLGVFMSYIQDIELGKVKLALFGLTESVKNVFEILGLDQLLAVRESEEEAKVALNEL